MPIDDSFKKEQLKKAKLHAISKGGECLSLEYVNSETKMQWRKNFITYK